MYLINTGTLELQYYIDAKSSPGYAILSHRWTDDEVTYKDFMKSRKKESAGYKKILDFCTVARRDGFEWAWADTCCIDKRSSAELQEAINSMFMYYDRAGRCYVHLADVTAAIDDTDFENQFISSQWFTRGWTLQELLAPDALRFYSKDWRLLGYFGRDPLGRRNGDYKFPDPIRRLKSLVSQASGVQEQYLSDSRSISHFNASLACRMSWASNRSTTRDEDLAYCLLGLFGVNMPLLYGEGGTKAFLRLQEGIMKTSDDHSLFAWRAIAPPEFYEGFGLLAESPRCFLYAQNIKVSNPRLWADTDPYGLTSRGLKIVLPLLYLIDDIYLAKLDCYYTDAMDMPVIFLRKLSGNKQIFERVFCGPDITPDSIYLAETVSDWNMETIYIKREETSIRGRVDGAFLLGPGKNSPYNLNTVTCTRNVGDSMGKGIPYLYEKRFGQSGFRLPARCFIPELATFCKISIRHEVAEEELLITIGPLAVYSIGFSAQLANGGAAQQNDTLLGSVERFITRNKALSISALPGPSSDRPTASPDVQLYRLGSRISVPSFRDQGRCHAIEVGIQEIQATSYATESYILYLRLSYDAVPKDHASDSSYVVVSPTGFQAERHSWRITLHPEDSIGDIYKAITARSEDLRGA